MNAQCAEHFGLPTQQQKQNPNDSGCASVRCYHIERRADYGFIVLPTYAIIPKFAFVSFGIDFQQRLCTHFLYSCDNRQRVM